MGDLAQASLYLAASAPLARELGPATNPFEQRLLARLRRELQSLAPGSTLGRALPIANIARSSGSDPEQEALDQERSE